MDHYAKHFQPPDELSPIALQASTTIKCYVLAINRPVVVAFYDPQAHFLHYFFAISAGHSVSMLSALRSLARHPILLECLPKLIGYYTKYGNGQLIGHTGRKYSQVYAVMVLSP